MILSAVHTAVPIIREVLTKKPLKYIILDLIIKESALTHVWAIGIKAPLSLVNYYGPVACAN